MYQKADYVITPSEYSKNRFSLTGYHDTNHCCFQMGLIWKNTVRTHVRKKFPRLLWYWERTTVVICAGLYFQTQGNWRFRQGCRERCLMFVSICQLVVSVKWLNLRSIQETVSMVSILIMSSLPGYFKGQSAKGAMSGANALFPVLRGNWRN